MTNLFTQGVHCLCCEKFWPVAEVWEPSRLSVPATAAQSVAGLRHNLCGCRKTGAWKANSENSTHPESSSG